MIYKVMVFGSIFYETSDELIAHRVAHCYRNIGWKQVSVLSKGI